MRILKILNSNDKGGILTCETQFIQELTKRGIVVDAVIIGGNKSAERYKRICNRSYSLPDLDAPYNGSTANVLSSIYRSYLFGATYSKQLSKQIQGAGSYDTIIYRRPNYIHLAGKLSKFTSSKTFWHLPNVVNGGFARNYYSLFCKLYNVVPIGNSVYTKDTLGELCKQVVYPGYDEQRVIKSKTNYREKLGIDGNAPVYGVAARLHRDKAQDLVVEAFIKSEIPRNGGHLIVAGGPLDSEFSHEVQRLANEQIGKQVHFLGEITSLSEFYSTVDVVVNGRRNAEPFGISIAEAMGAGKPVIAYYLGGPSEMVIPNENGWLVYKPTVENFVAAFNESLENRYRWNTMGNDAKLRSSKYGVKSNVDKLIDIIGVRKEYV